MAIMPLPVHFRPGHAPAVNRNRAWVTGSRASNQRDILRHVFETDRPVSRAHASLPPNDPAPQLPILLNPAPLHAVLFQRCLSAPLLPPCDSVCHYRGLASSPQAAPANRPKHSTRSSCIAASRGSFTHISAYSAESSPYTSSGQKPGRR